MNYFDLEFLDYSRNSTTESVVVEGFVVSSEPRLGFYELVLESGSNERRIVKSPVRHWVGECFFVSKSVWLSRVVVYHDFSWQDTQSIVQNTVFSKDNFYKPIYGSIKVGVKREKPTERKSIPNKGKQWKRGKFFVEGLHEYFLPYRYLNLVSSRCGGLVLSQSLHKSLQYLLQSPVKAPLVLTKEAKLKFEYRLFLYNRLLVALTRTLKYVKARNLQFVKLTLFYSISSYFINLLNYRAFSYKPVSCDTIELVDLPIIINWVRGIGSFGNLDDDLMSIYFIYTLLNIIWAEDAKVLVGAEELTSISFKKQIDSGVSDKKSFFLPVVMRSE